MKLATVITATLMLIACGALAADAPKTSLPTPPSPLKEYQEPLSCLTVLKCDPMLEEIHWIKMARIVQEEDLLDDLAKAKTSRESNRIIQELNQLDYNQELDILLVQMRYARIDGQYDLAREIKGEIVALLSVKAIPLP